ncbi:hypothetical protein BpHYR1_042009 [Brachionus plicatilis]|uniref:Uncharacterized protein n=1 Tax=Brachionus plicatilis TaxID=10195 RepID=A0A3M7PLK0_BRAPC|nr:hypothetical protein BpHYR1_042009 [Brachionus plicatilis]
MNREKNVLCLASLFIREFQDSTLLLVLGKSFLTLSCKFQISIGKRDDIPALFLIKSKPFTTSSHGTKASD